MLQELLLGAAALCKDRACNDDDDNGDEDASDDEASDHDVTYCLRLSLLLACQPHLVLLKLLLWLFAY